MTAFNFLSLRSTILGPCFAGLWIKNPEILNTSVVGVSNDDDDINGYWKSEKIQEFRRSIADGTHSMCDHTKCPHLIDPDHSWCMKTKEEIQNDPDKIWATETMRFLEAKDSFNLYPRTIGISYDPSCNLTCVGCRKKNNKS